MPLINSEKIQCKSLFPINHFLHPSYHTNTSNLFNAEENTALLPLCFITQQINKIRFVPRL